MRAVLLIVFGFACAVADDGGPTYEIVDGSRASRDRYPWFVSFFYEGFNVAGNEMFCGGSILDERFILSAAHCFYGYNDLSPYYLAAGKYKLFEDLGTEQYRNISKFTIHPGFNNDTYENDIVVVEVDRPFVFNKFVQPTTLADSGNEPKTDCWMPGLGWTDERQQTMATVMQEYQMNLVSRKRCKFNARVFSREAEITSRVLCSKNKRQGACYYDSGGPVGCFSGQNYTQIGVRSWTLADQDCKKGWNVIMRVTKYLGFINKIIAS